jgi:hypothetical protein
MTFTLTIIGGIIILIISQLILKTIIEPILEQRKVRGRIVHALSYFRFAHNTFIFNLPADEKERGEWVKDIQEANNEIRSLAADLRVTLVSVPFYRLFEFFRVVVLPEENIRGIVHELFRWSKLDDRRGVEDAISKLKALLKIDFKDPSSVNEIANLEFKNFKAMCDAQPKHPQHSPIYIWWLGLPSRLHQEADRVWGRISHANGRRK